MRFKVFPFLTVANLKQFTAALLLLPLLMSSLSAWHHATASQRLDGEICYSLNSTLVGTAASAQVNAGQSKPRLVDTLSFADIGLPTPVKAGGEHCDTCFNAGALAMPSPAPAYTLARYDTVSDIVFVKTEHNQTLRPAYQRPPAQAPPVSV